MKELAGFKRAGLSTQNESVVFSVKGQVKQGGEDQRIGYSLGRDTVLDNEHGIKFMHQYNHGVSPVNIRIVSNYEEAMKRRDKRMFVTYRNVADLSDGSDFRLGREALNKSNILTQERVNDETNSLVDIEVHLKGNPKDWKIVVREKFKHLLSGQGNEIDSADSAMTSSPIVSKTKGGIDLNPNNIRMQTQGDGVKIVFPKTYLNIPAESVDGFVPIIINVTPINNIPMLLGGENTPDDVSSDLSYVK